jgi:hypothetical protein
MTVPVGVARIQYFGTGSAGPFAFNFVLYDQTHLKITRTSLLGVDTVLALTTDYTVAIASDNTSATVMLVAPLAGTGLAGSSEKLTIVEDPPISQLVEWSRNDPFPFQTHQRAADLAVLLIGRLSERLNRAPLLAESSSFSGIILPNPVAGTFLGWNAGATNLENKTLASIGAAVFPLASTDNAVVRFDGASGLAFQNSGVLISDTNDISFSGDFTQSQKASGGQWKDVSPFVNIARVDRLFIGEAVNATGNFTGQGSIIPTSTQGANWILRDAQAIAISEVGLIGIAGISRSDQASAPTEAIGVAGFTINSKASGLAWGGYFEVQHESGAGSSYAIELDTKNKGSNVSFDPYTVSGVGAFGLWIVGGGDPSYGGVAANPSAAALVILNNGHTWNSGIVFRKGALTGDDGTTGTGIAIDMAKGHTLRWLQPGSLLGGAIRCDVATSGKDVSLIFSDDQFAFYSTGGHEIFSGVRPILSPVNNIRVFNAATGVAPSVAAIGSDTNVDLSLSPQGTGIVRSAAGIKSSSASQGIGYVGAANSTVTQATSKSTAVTINTPSGQITMNNASLGAGAAVQPTVNCSSYNAVTDTVVAHHASGGSLGSYTVNVMAIGANAFAIRVTNTTGGALAEAIVINYSIIKGS